ncbi:hypothetical protein [Streptomyces sp. NPDC002088]|uniref:hypothetical protein n=1 Tax=Streptomyces sp. NPDC002088 TaxID=3154665 RepID=UPI003332BFDD
MVEDRASGLNDEDRYGATLHIQDLREQLAANVGDTDRYIGVVARDLRTPGQYPKITEALLDAARTEEATVWARRGLAAHPTSPYLPPLRDALVDLLTRAGNEEEALRPSSAPPYTRSSIRCRPPPSASEIHRPFSGRSACCANGYRPTPPVPGN